jgi:PleD family two-component response regulator
VDPRGRDQWRPAEASASTAEGSPAPLRILLAKDNTVNQTVALRLLERLEHRADVESDGHQVLEMLEQAPYDVILMDVQMPGMDGSRRAGPCARWPLFRVEAAHDTR